ncbi:MAG: SLBB domain-containing protein, partial [Phycisphaerae bacterium]|nr:SLBB domain-containing protein [Phycisphaerae bacterium]
QQAEPLVLPVKGLNIPFADVVLAGGETVEVERLDPPVFMVTGLVKRPGPFPYPPSASYTLSQALAFAGGVDEKIDPRYAKVYRRDAEGRVVSCVFKITGNGQIDTSRLLIKPGDIVAVEHTQRTRTRQAMANMFRISTGMVVGATYDLNPD